jgi:excisionase family DNA binding protein
MTARKYTLRQAARELGIPYSERIYSVREAARRLTISDCHCRRLLEAGKIKGKKLGHDWVVLKLDYKRKRKPKTKKGGQSDEKS